MIEQYIKKMEELRELGEQILDSKETTGSEFWFDELDCMSMHLDISLKILRQEIAE